MNERPLRIGMVSPYSWDVPGGVQFHIRDLAETLLAQGHHVSVLTPVQRSEDLPDYVVDAGRAVPIRYNGSVARIQFGVVSGARARSWLTRGEFDVIHVHEPQTLSLSLIACMMASCPIVATVHAATERSRTLAALQAPLQPFLERISGRIAVSELARRLQVEHLGGDAVLIPNGVFVEPFATAEPIPALCDGRPTIGFLGRFDEPRKGLQVLLPAMVRVVRELPGVRLAIAGRGDEAQLVAELPVELADSVDVLGPLSEGDKARFLRSLDAYCAPNTGGESFGIILAEAMAAGAPVIASDIDAFRRVLDDGRAGMLTAVGDSDALASGLIATLTDTAATEARRAAAAEVVKQYDWSVVARKVLAVYRTVVGR
ncbi:glycosyltransferase family 4 protein [Blastococcus sp. Marseille-P5729]|uniref:glycosyltransferase family 4 protein n=1 Tax=Blastococcus sp. Marseille-P5729 TaxID=2086582 RepID=UPI001F3664A0|nr:glycosyltransferase family 4 protein [Blastococcus sp. Marseille-P5729]